MLWVFIRIDTNKYPQHMFLWRNNGNYPKLSSDNPLSVLLLPRCTILKAYFLMVLLKRDDLETKIKSYCPHIANVMSNYVKLYVIPLSIDCY